LKRSRRIRPQIHATRPDKPFLTDEPLHIPTEPSHRPDG